MVRITLLDSTLESEVIVTGVMESLSLEVGLAIRVNVDDVQSMDEIATEVLSSDSISIVPGTVELNLAIGREGNSVIHTM